MTSASVVLAAPFSLPDPGPNPVSLLLLLAGMSLLPFLLVMFTSFTKMSVVLSLTRSALGTQQAPPTMVLTGLAAVLSLVVMSPVAEAMVARVQGERLPAAPGPEMLRVVRSASEPLRAFLVEHGSWISVGPNRGRARRMAVGPDIRADVLPQLFIGGDNRA